MGTGSLPASCNHGADAWPPPRRDSERGRRSSAGDKRHFDTRQPHGRTACLTACIQGLPMNDTTAGSLPAKSYAEKRWQSDIIVDLIKQFGFPYIALNPGASYRGLHDSLVNYGGNDPPMLLCQHEKIAVQIAHGYAQAPRRPRVAIAHDVVGMLHATMGLCHRRYRPDGREPAPAVHRLD